MLNIRHEELCNFIKIDKKTEILSASINPVAMYVLEDIISIYHNMLVDYYERWRYMVDECNKLRAQEEK